MVTLTVARGARLVWPLDADHPELLAEGTYHWTQLVQGKRPGREGSGRWDASRGAVVAEGLPGGTYRLESRVPGYAPLLSAPVSVNPGEEAHLALGVLDPGLVLEGVVIDEATGDPVVGAELRAEPGDGATFRTPRDLQTGARATAGTEGRFRLSGLEPRSYTIRVDAPGYAEKVLSDVKPEEGTTDLGEIALDHGALLTGTVTTRSGAAVPDAVVELWEPGPYVFEPMRTTSTDSDGGFRLDLVPEGRWRLLARSGLGTGKTAVSVTAGEEVEVEITVGGVTVEGRVWIADEPASHGRVVLSTSGEGGGLTVAVRRPGETHLFGPDLEGRHMTVVDGEGRFVLADVEPGTYTASYTPDSPGAGAMSTTVTVPDVQRHWLELRFAGGTVEGRVVDPWRHPLSGARVVLVSERGQRTATSTQDGAFRFEGLSAGHLTLIGKHSEYRDSEPVDVELEEGAVVSGLEIELRPPAGASVELRLVPQVGSAAGAPAMLFGAASETAFADTTGVVTWTDVRPGRYVACARPYGGALGCTPPFTVEEADDREVALETGGGGYLRVPAGGAGGVHIGLTDGTSLDTLLILSGAVHQEEDGALIGPLAEGSYLVLDPSTGVPRTVTVSEGETTTLEP